MSSEGLNPVSRPASALASRIVPSASRIIIPAAREEKIPRKICAASAGLELGPPARPRSLVGGNPRRVVPPGPRLGFQQGVEAAPGLPDPQFPARLVGIQRRDRGGDRRPGREPLREQLALVAGREVFRSQATVPTRQRL